MYHVHAGEFVANTLDPITLILKDAPCIYLSDIYITHSTHLKENFWNDPLPYTLLTLVITLKKSFVILSTPQ